MASRQQVLLGFDTIFDSDIGAVKVLIDKYANPKFVIDNIKEADDNDLRTLLAVREDINPLTAVLKKDYHGDTANSLYHQLRDKEWDLIVDNSSTSAIYDVVKGLISTNANMDFTVMCKSEEEEAIAKEFDIGSTFVTTDLHKVDIDKYDNIFVKNFQNVLRFKPVMNKNIYVARLMYNLTPILGEFVPKMDINVIVGRVNKIMIIDYYAGFLPSKYTQKTASETNTDKETNKNG